ncbi:MAG TPA: tetratricopeptide repeat protein [Pirellulales bacterium]|nr:tetratricopeptide repeat protein [Pirellulales bacterium]
MSLATADEPAVARYNNLGFKLNAQGKYAEAQPLFEKALALQLKLLGEKHSDTALSYNNLAYNLHCQAKYDVAEPLYRKAVKLAVELLGEKHPTTATIYSNLALNLNAQEKYADAESLYHKALAIRLKLLGEKHPDTAASYNNLAANLDSQGKHAEAQPLYQKALDLRRELLGEEHHDTATSLNNLAYNLNVQGKYAEAQPLFRKSLQILLRLLGEKHPNVARCYMNVAKNLDSQGKYAEAEPMHKKALELSREVLGEKHTLTGLCYGNLAQNLKAQERFSEAEGLFRTAIGPPGEQHADTAQSYDNLAQALCVQVPPKYDQAQPLFEKALALRRKLLGEKHPYTAASHNRLATVLDAQEKHADAQPLFEKALALYCELLGEQHPHSGETHMQIAVNLHAQGKYADARRRLLQAAASYEAGRLSVAERGLERAVFGLEHSPYRLLAAIEARLGDAEAAWVAAETDLARGLSDETASRRQIALTAEEENRRAALADRLAAIAPRILQLVLKQTPTDEEKNDLRRLKQERRTLEAEVAELAVALSQRELAPLTDVQAALADDAAVLLWVDVRGSLQEHWGCVVRRTGEPIWEPLPGVKLSFKRSGLETDEPVVRWKFGRQMDHDSAGEDVAGLAKNLYARRLAPLVKHLHGIKRLIVVPANEMAGMPVDVLTDKYTVSYVPSGTLLARLKSRPSGEGRSLLALGDPWPLTPGPTEAPRRSPGGLLIVQVVPGGNAAKAGLLPGDRLLTWAGVEAANFEQVFEVMRKHGPRKPVPVSVSRLGKIISAELQRGDPGMAFNLADQTAASATRGGVWSELPATAIEVRRIAALAGKDRSLVLTRSAASEQELERLRTSGKLARFRYLHFATHGEPNNERSFESALILSRQPVSSDDPMGGGESHDGRLTANEVLENWQISADLVTLSACESALGRPGGGDGLLGFSQAFLLAGARSVCLSLWKVDDTATAILMERFYQNLFGKRAGLSRPMPKAESLAEAKRWLKELTIDEATKLAADICADARRSKGEPALNRTVPRARAKAGSNDRRPFAHPRFWAAFILIGDPN